MITIIGDVHGLENEYKKITQVYDKTIQVGDMNFDYEFFRTKKIDSANHKFFCGNHDNPDKAKLCPNNLGLYGELELEGKKGYFVSGALSIDRHMRTEGYDWWPNEQLSYDNMTRAIADYLRVKPDIMLTHDCPYSIRQIMWGYQDRTTTAMGLEMMYNGHNPKLWIFGHHHKALDEEVMGTRFICLPELKTFTI